MRFICEILNLSTYFSCENSLINTHCIYYTGVTNTNTNMLMIYYIGSALVYKQECITEYYAIQLEPILTHAKSCISPNNQRKPLFSFSSHHCKSDHKLLALFLEVDCDLTKLLRELIDALIAVNLTDLTIAVQSLLSSIGPIQTYMLTATGTTSISNMEQVATPRESDDEGRVCLLVWVLLSFICRYVGFIAY